MASKKNVSIHRAPVLTLWAALVAQRLGVNKIEALTLGRDGHRVASPDSDIHLGTGTCESGPPGNRLRFWYVETESFTPLVRAFNGRVTVDGLWGLEAADGDWNFGDWEPLIVNLSFRGTRGYVATKKVGHNQLLLRYSTDCDALIQSPFDHPHVLRLRRVADEAE